MDDINQAYRDHANDMARPVGQNHVYHAMRDVLEEQDAEESDREREDESTDGSGETNWVAATIITGLAVVGYLIYRTAPWFAALFDAQPWLSTYYLAIAKAPVFATLAFYDFALGITPSQYSDEVGVTAILLFAGMVLLLATWALLKSRWVRWLTLVALIGPLLVGISLQLLS